jgi:integrase
MPLEIYQRGKNWWARGRVEYDSTPITGYYRCSIGTSSEASARRWCADEERRKIRNYLLGDEKALTFAEAVVLYPAAPADALYLTKIVPLIGALLVKDITPKMIKNLGETLLPDASTDTWVRQIITPVRAVINNAHDLGQCSPIRVRGYTNEERVAQDLKRGKKSRIKRQPGSWEWLLRFRQHASQRHAALAMLMFMTGARISQAVAMHPHKHLDLANGRICIPAAKGHAERWIDIAPELQNELAALPPLYPRGVLHRPENLRVFGFADRSSPRKGWNQACANAGIERLPFHAAGRHGFGQELNVRQPIDEKAAGQFGGWSDTTLMRRTYTHAEEVSAKVHDAQRRGLRLAEEKTKIKLTDK